MNKKLLLMIPLSLLILTGCGLLNDNVKNDTEIKKDCIRLEDTDLYSTTGEYLNGATYTPVKKCIYGEVVK